jgi:HAD superfamily hydrolase (TIGR01509 family)
VQLRAVIFDMDGVLIDSEPLHFEATRRVLADHGVAYSAADNEEFLGITAFQTYATLRRRHRLAVAERDLVQAYSEELLRIIPDRAQPMAGVPEVLEELRAAGLRLALASSAEPEVIRATLNGLCISGVFEVVISGAEVERGKPAPDIFLEAARRLGVPPGACLVVEDSRNGVLAARAAGIHCVAIPCPTTAGQDLSAATARLGSLLALPAFVAGRGAP